METNKLSKHLQSGKEGYQSSSQIEGVSCLSQEREEC